MNTREFIGLRIEAGIRAGMTMSAAIDVAYKQLDQWIGCGLQAPDVPECHFALVADLHHPASWEHDPETLLEFGMALALLDYSKLEDSFATVVLPDAIKAASEFWKEFQRRRDAGEEPGETYYVDIDEAVRRLAESLGLSAKEKVDVGIEELDRLQEQLKNLKQDLERFVRAVGGGQ